MYSMPIDTFIIESSSMVPLNTCCTFSMINTQQSCVLIAGKNGSLVRDGGPGSLSLRAPEAYGVHDVLVAKSVFRCVGNILVCLKQYIIINLSREYHPVLVAQRRRIVCSGQVSSVCVPLSQSHQTV